MKLLLHCCCAPCTLSCADSLRGEGIEPRLFWYNPNIHPLSEYNARLACLKEFAANEKLKLEMQDEYGLRFFLAAVYRETEGTQLPARCRICYSLRLEKTASFAAENGYCAFSTSLLISTYQDHDAIRRIGNEAALKYGVDFFYRDFRPLFSESRRKARSLGLYMQKYCGCVFSEEERYAKKKEDKPQSTRSCTEEEN